MSEHSKFAKLVRTRWTVSLVFSAIMLVAYFGFILIVAFRKEWLGVSFSGSIPWSIPVGIGLILLSWILTGFYIYWANTKYDSMIDEIKKEENQSAN